MADYVIYPDSVGKTPAAKAKAYAKRRSKEEPGTEFRVENIYTGKVIARYRNGIQTNPAKRSASKRVSSALKKYLHSLKGNPAKGRKVKGGRAVSLKNFTGTVTRTSRGQVQIRGKAR